MAEVTRQARSTMVDQDLTEAKEWCCSSNRARRRVWTVTKPQPLAPIEDVGGAGGVCALINRGTLQELRCAAQLREGCEDRTERRLSRPTKVKRARRLMSDGLGKWMGSSESETRGECCAVMAMAELDGGLDGAAYCWLVLGR